VVIGIEGVNEPNHERSGGSPPADWPERTVAIQKIIWDFGLWRTPSLDPATWTEKPEASVLRTFLGSLQDPGDDFAPKPVRLDVQAPEGVKSLVVGKRNGSAALLLWQNTGIYDPARQEPITVGAASVEVRTHRKAVTVSVPAGEVVRLQL